MHSVGEQAEVEEIAKAVGFAISEWGQLEDILCSLHVAAIRAPIYSLAHASFYSIASFHGKVKAVDVPFKLAFANEPGLLGDWIEVRKLAKSLTEKRNGLAHGAVRVIYTDPKIVGWFPFWNGTDVTKGWMMAGKLVVPPDGLAPHYSSHDIGLIAAGFKEATAKATALFESVASHLHATGKHFNHEQL